MEFGFGVPTRGAMATPENLATLAKQGEHLGFGIISVSDHVIIPKAIASTYPYNESGSFVSSPSGECMEQLTLLTFLAGVTSTARLLTSVMVVPHRPPVLTAKILATIDVLSKGRLIVDCGVGWMREERSTELLKHGMAGHMAEIVGLSRIAKPCGKSSRNPGKRLLQPSFNVRH